MDLFLILLGFLFVLLGIAGSFLPVLPGPITGWIGLLFLYLTSAIPVNYMVLGIALALSLLIWVLDYIIPSIGTKKFGGSKYGVIGTSIGLIIGLILPIPLGFLIGAFLGALIGELIYDGRNIKRALKAAFGSFLGFLASTALKILVSLFFAGFFIYKVVENWSDII